MKKLKANSILASFIFAFSLLMLCSFGTDACYVILSRYKLQKITEAVAFEYASSLARNLEGTPLSQTEKNNKCTFIKDVYQSIYNSQNSGILVFKINNMEYKENTDDKTLVVKVDTTARVLPAFLRFVGVKEILIHGVSFAKSERIEITKTIEAGEKPDTLNIDAYREYYTNLSGMKAEFLSPFEEKNDLDEITKKTDVISSKENANGDFAIQFKYKNSTLNTSGGGFFIFGSYEGFKNSGVEPKYTDIGYKAKDADIKRICLKGNELNYFNGLSTDEYTNCFYCINSAKNNKVTFDLSKEGEEWDGDTRRLSAITVYKAGGSGEDTEGGYKDPCDIEFTKMPPVIDPSSMLVGDYVNREVEVKLTILNNVYLIKRWDYNNFIPTASSAESEDKGSCPI